MKEEVRILELLLLQKPTNEIIDQKVGVTEEGSGLLKVRTGIKHLRVLGIVSTIYGLSIRR